MRMTPPTLSMKAKRFALVAFSVLLALGACEIPVFAQGTTFTYQGSLSLGGIPASGVYDFTFALFDNNAAGQQIGVTSTNLGVAVTNGVFSATLDFGANFPGAPRWLRIGVRANGGGAFTLLNPLQGLTPTPYAITAASAGSVLAGNVVGTVALAQLPASIVTNGSGNLNLQGSFTGNGSGLTNLSANVLAGLPPQYRPGMAYIPAGTFIMGDTIHDGDIANTTPISVTLSAFYMEVNLVTLSQWQSVYYWATNHGYSFNYPGSGTAPNQPVQNVNWFDCLKWCNARSQQAGKNPVYYSDAAHTKIYTNGETSTYFPVWNASGYRLPTEAEWEKAARGGLIGQRFPWGNIINQNLANYTGATGSYAYDAGPDGMNDFGTVVGTAAATSVVGSFAPNAFGLYDMAGNLDAWCYDWSDSPYAGGTDPRGPDSGPTRIVRGGSWGDGANICRVANRNGGYPALGYDRIGFRCVTAP